MVTEKRIAVDIGILVGDMERALEFYRDLLGLSVVGEARTSLIGAGRMVQLRHGDSLIKLVALDERPSARTNTGVGTTLGLRYLTLMVADIEPLMEKIEREDVPVVIPLTRLGNGAQIAMVADPEGNVVEFVQEA